MASSNHPGWVRLATTVRAFFTSGVRGKARLFLAGMIGLLLAISILNVLNSYVGRDFMTALVNRQGADFYRLALLFVGVFAASTVAAAVQSYTQGRLGLLWREWLTDRLVNSYMLKRTYLRLRTTAGVDNPDERISEDVRAFTESALGFVVLLLNGAITAIAFTGVTWSISPLLFGVCVGYAVLGSFGTVLLGRRLAGLNAKQLALEADFRSSLYHVRENAVAIALTRAEAPLHQRAIVRLTYLVVNFRSILLLNLKLSLFTGGYNYLIQIIPALVVGPMYLRGEVEFGVVTQAAMAFAQLVGALSLIITQFGAISSFAAVASRVNGLSEAMEQGPTASTGGIATVEAGDQLVFEDLTLKSAGGERTLVNELSAASGPGSRLAVIGRNEPAQMALFQAASGLWEKGHGRIFKPPPADIFFLPQTPYVIPGTLRDQFISIGPSARDDKQILAALAAVGLGTLAEEVGGLDVEKDWPHHLTTGQQQGLAVARVLLARPRLAVLDRVSWTLNPSAYRNFIGCLAKLGTGLVVFTGQDETPDCCERILELKPDGSWSLENATRSRSPAEQGEDGSVDLYSTGQEPVTH